MTDTKPKNEVKQTEAKPKKEKTVNKKALGLWERIFNVQQGIKTVIKTGENTHHKYPYATERDILSEVKPLLGTERLVVTSTTKKHTVTEKKHEVEIEFTITNVDKPAEKVSEVFYGFGEDKEGSVVGLPIAYTMAVKYFMAKYFLVETGNDAESDQNSTPDGKGTKKGKVELPKESPEQAVETIKNMLRNSRNVDGIIDYLTNKLPKIKQFTKEQKEEINRIGSNRVDELQAGDKK